MGGAATPEDSRGEDEGRSCQVQHRPWRSWQLVYSSPRGISQGLLQLFRQQWQRTKWILRPFEPHPRAPLDHLLLTRYIFLRFSKRRSAFIIINTAFHLWLWFCIWILHWGLGLRNGKRKKLG